MNKVKLISLSLIITLVFSCSYKKEVEKSKITLNTKVQKSQDSNKQEKKQIKNSLEDKDKVESIIENSKENYCRNNFDVFFKLFSSNDVFQRNNVKFPLSISYIKDLETNEIGYEKYENKRKWKFIDFSEDKDAIHRESDKFETITFTHDNFKYYKQIGIDNGILVIYKFELINGCWKLTEVKDESA